MSSPSRHEKCIKYHHKVEMPAYSMASNFHDGMIWGTLMQLNGPNKLNALISWPYAVG